MKQHIKYFLYVFLLSMLSLSVHASDSDENPWTFLADVSDIFDESSEPPILLQEICRDIPQSPVYAHVPLLDTLSAQEVPEEAGIEMLPVDEPAAISSASSTVQPEIPVPVRAKRQRKIKPLPSSEHAILCIVCNKNFSTKDHLQKHIKNVHEQLRQQCPSCDKSFSNRGNLTMHIKGIHEKKKYRCPSCPSTFTRNANLQEHIKSIHEKITYQCEICTKHFSQKQYLNQHIRVLHEGERTPCPYCDTLITFKQGISYHMRTKHPEIADSRKRQRGNG